MKALASILGGVCLFEEGRQRHFVNVIDMSAVSPETAHLVCGAIDDWESIDRAATLAASHVPVMWHSSDGVRERSSTVSINREVCPCSARS